jgi:predicted transcriptional regulator
MSRGAKQQAIDIIETIPEDASIEEVMETLYLLTKVRRGLAQIEDGRVVSHDEATRRLRAMRLGGSFP